MNLAIRRLFDYDVLDDERFFTLFNDNIKSVPFFVNLALLKEIDFNLYPR